MMFSASRLRDRSKATCRWALGEKLAGLVYLSRIISEAFDEIHKDLGSVCVLNEGQPAFEQCLVECRTRKF